MANQFCILKFNHIIVQRFEQLVHTGLYRGFYHYYFSRIPITRTPANSNQNRFPVDFVHTLTVILPSVTRTLDNSNLSLTRTNFPIPSSNFVYYFTLDNSNNGFQDGPTLAGAKSFFSATERKACERLELL